jgi:hypothetical protein
MIIKEGSYFSKFLFKGNSSEFELRAREFFSNKVYLVDYYSVDSNENRLEIYELNKNLNALDNISFFRGKGYQTHNYERVNRPIPSFVFTVRIITEGAQITAECKDLAKVGELKIFVNNFRRLEPIAGDDEQSKSEKGEPALKNKEPESWEARVPNEDDRKIIRNLRSDEPKAASDISEALNVIDKTIYNRESVLRDSLTPDIVPFRQKWRNRKWHKDKTR